MYKNKITITLFLFTLSILACNCSKETIIKVPTIADVPKITKETKDNITGLRSLSENYVIKNVKKGNKLLEETRKTLEKAEKKDKKRL